jgi:hypothetical protein
MQYSLANIRSRAGLVALVFALIISLVSAVPIPATESGLSSTLSHRDININPTHNGLDSAKISTPLAGPRALTHRVRFCYLLSIYWTWLIFNLQHLLTETDDQLVRRSKIGDKIKHAFQVC